MRNLYLVVSVVLAALAAQASQAGTGFDGCYQLDDGKETLHPSPIICLSGTAEVLINGAGVRAGIFSRAINTLDCGKSTSSRMTRKSFVWIFDGREEIVLRSLNTSNGLKSGNAIFKGEKFTFKETEAWLTSRLLTRAYVNCDW
jgi:hypothetical protein